MTHGLQGEADPAFEGVAEALERQVERSGGGAAVCVYHRGRKVVDVWAGTRDPEGRPWESDTLSMSFSTTKGVMATLIHILADQGKLDYDEPVATYWPEFGRAGKERITVRELLSHRSGLPHIRSIVDHGKRMLDWRYMVAALERTRPSVRPGSRSAYHALTFGWLVGELIRRLTGKPLSQALNDELAEPLGLEGCFIGAPKAVRHRTAHLNPPGAALAEGWMPNTRFTRALTRLNRMAGLPFDPHLMQEALLVPNAGDVLFGREILDAEVPAANGCFTARSLARVYAMLAGGGQLEGVRLMSRERVARAAEVQTKAPDRVLVLPMHWRLGYHSAFSSRGRIDGAYGHFGYGGSGAFVDPRRELAVAMVNNRAGGGPFGDTRIAFLASAALKASHRIRTRSRAAARATITPAQA
ncbi:MAG: serine hydrolase domain-containing protein [Myxococcota bacterium]|nr:serine hydrolase domain-containing protein [Myxococcota bacterium]